MAPQITWSVYNPFRLFQGDDEIVALSDPLLAAMVAQPSLSDAYPNYYQNLVAKYRYGKDSSKSIDLYSHTRYNRISGDYSPAAGETYYPTPTSQIIRARLTGAANPGDMCAWKINGSAQVSAQCGTEVRITLPYPPETFAFVGMLQVSENGVVVAETELATSDLLIVAFGDSYAAGEGSPDHPVDVTSLTVANPFDPSAPMTWWRSVDSLVAPRNGALPSAASADWWSVECHRSLLSPQVAAALKLAAADPHRSVTFLSYSCAGAAVLDGLLTPQQHPPGQDQLEALEHTAPPRSIEGYAQSYSQLQRAVTDLCAPTNGSYDQPYTAANRYMHYEDYHWDVSKIPTWNNIIINKTDERAYPQIPVCDKYIRHPDFVFLTIGGNDIGFSGLGAWSLTPPNFFNAPDFLNPVTDQATGVALEFGGSFLSWSGLALVCPSTPYETATTFLGIPTPFKTKDPRCNPNPTDVTAGGADRLIRVELPELMKGLQSFFDRSNPLTTGVVVQETYPNPTRDEAGNLCGSPNIEFSTTDELQEPWLAERASIPSLVADSQFLNLQIYLRAAAAPVVERLAFDDTIGAISLSNTLKAFGRGNWIITAPVGEALKHGICAGTGQFAADFGFPRGAMPRRPPPNEWDPNHPSPRAWSAYAPRPRWFRTANDSLLTEAVSVSRNEILPEALSGTIHPTAQGNAAVADRLYDAAVAHLPKSLPLP